MDVKKKALRTVTSRLGGNVVYLEIQEEDILLNIESALDKISSRVMVEDILEISASSVVTLPDNVEEVTEVLESTLGYSTGCFDETQAAIITKGQSIYNRIYNFSYSQNHYSDNKTFDFYKPVLYLHNFTGLLTVKYYRYPELGDLHKDYYSWVIDYAVALCKESIGRVRSKMKVTGSPIELDGESMLSEAQQEKDKLEETLKEFGSIIFRRD